MKLKKIVKFVAKNRSKFSSSENIADLATYCYKKYKSILPSETIVDRLSCYIDPPVFMEAYADARNKNNSEEYVGGEIFKALCEIDRKDKEQRKQNKELKAIIQLMENTNSQPLTRQSATNMRKDSTLLSISGGMISLQRSRYAKLHEDYDDR